MLISTIETLNKEVRDVFLEWYMDAMKPNMRMVAERVGLGYSTMKNFKAGHNTTYNNIIKITNFLKSQGYEVKQPILV
ncbi:hypothetical protein KEI82_002502 [Staphylococcus pseudintermedius]|uniref:hypothetical protein n=1 Tax=Staphylococcus pseudintermedius TaxID=283734 RepID=UPI0018F6978E|nr:hypothetical protein [Staphylococcus pseudintermedius]EGQ3068525.1 hypothetical protein [Staphylococcus pseudintermedius]EGQ3151800.1 hypothetical protein [Staphylococcus pseudintermedius]EGQ3871491.1 hypothetical protein [Staphylococcus pseudintermedius]EHL7209642.1 hypothetical protein [Staphylococcus pseudintermedius]EHT6215653.1 hypothetical protein [Staphylococcus pseudintermedius]